MIKRELITIGLALVSAFIAGSLLIWVIGESPLGIYKLLISTTWGTSYGIGQVLFKATPLILTGLAVAIAFRAGLFNIGAEGQLAAGSFAAAVCGASLPAATPGPIAVFLCICAAMIAGALIGALPGLLKARYGAHEVINTIMMNFIAIQLTDWLVNNPMKDPGGPSIIRTPFIKPTAEIPQFSELFPNLFAQSDRLHFGFVLAIAVALFIWWLLWKTTIGFELRTAGANPDAAEYAGVRSDRTIILAMALSGALAGLAGTIEVQGLNRALPAFFQAGYGFDAIAVALLGQNHPFGVIPSAIIFGALTTGSDVLQIRTGVSRHMVSIIQALILLFVAAPAMVRWLYRLRLEKTEVEEVPLTRGWG